MIVRWLAKKDGTRVLQYKVVEGWTQYKVDSNGNSVIDYARSQATVWEDVQTVREE